MFSDTTSALKDKKITQKTRLYICQAGRGNVELEIKELSNQKNTLLLGLEIKGEAYSLLLKKTSNLSAHFKCEFVEMLDNKRAKLGREDFNRLLNCKKTVREYNVYIEYFLDDTCLSIHDKKLLGHTVFEYEDDYEESKMVLLFTADGSTIDGAIEVEACCGQNSASISGVTIL